MADYNLNGLNPHDFQHLAQALAGKRIAIGVTAFGDGKDGNRDLTHRGKMDYPSYEKVWDGYLVLGCKFNQRPTGDTWKNGDWAVTQLTADLKKFLNPDRDLPKPEYYIFATNIALPGVAESGGRDRITKVFGATLTILMRQGGRCPRRSMSFSRVHASDGGHPLPPLSDAIIRVLAPLAPLFSHRV